jgi:hypothetical protein
MVICPTTVTHVAYLYHNILINFGTSLTFVRLRLHIRRRIVKLVIVVKEIANMFVHTLEAALFCMCRLFLLVCRFSLLAILNLSSNYWLLFLLTLIIIAILLSLLVSRLLLLLSLLLLL